MTRDANDSDARRLVIRGRVQGVWYRGWLQELARSCGVTGWVRNRPDGSVEAVVEGPSAVLDAVVASCHDGPPAARVDAVESAQTSRQGFDAFDVRA